MYSVEIKFSKGLEKMLDKNTYSKVIQGTLLDIAVEAEGITRREAPIKTGYLRRTTTKFANGMVSGVKTKAEYWKYVEYGTKFQEPNPFVKRALDRVRRDKIPSTALSRNLDKYVK